MTCDYTNTSTTHAAKHLPGHVLSEIANDNPDIMVLIKK